MSDLYCDGGVIDSNPSVFGGTFAWCLIQEDQIVKEGSGVLLPVDIGLPTVTNNVMELYAAMAAISQMEVGWRGTLWTDSKVTMFRLGSSQALNGVPSKMRLQCVEIRRARKWQVKLLKGHPTQAMLRKGYVVSRFGGRVPVSKWNVYCDEKCQKLAEEFLIAEDNIYAAPEQ